jgi:hypothetical protein
MSDLIYSDGIKRIRASQDQAISSLPPAVTSNIFGEIQLPTLADWRSNEVKDGFIAELLGIGSQESSASIKQPK